MEETSSDPEKLFIESSTDSDDDIDNFDGADDRGVLCPQDHETFGTDSSCSDASSDVNSIDSDVESLEENYGLKGEESSEYLLGLDDMNEDELQDLLEKLERKAASAGALVGDNEQIGEDKKSAYGSDSTSSDSSLQILRQESDIKTRSYVAPNSELYPSLHILEITFYFCFYWMVIFYCLYRFSNTCQKWATYLPLSSTPENWFGKYRDDTDLEWYVWPPLLMPKLHLVLLHSFIALFVRKRWHQHLMLYYIVTSCCVIYFVIGAVGLIVCLTVPSLIFTVVLTRKKRLVWCAWCFILIGFNVEPTISTLEQYMASVIDGDYKVSVMVAWIILRSLSFALETSDSDPQNNIPIKRQLLLLFSYCLYLPFLFTGPFMPYVKFLAGLNAPPKPWSLKRLFQTALQILRFLAWAFISTLLLHYFYSHSLQYSPQLVLRLNSWSMSGFIYFLFIFFVIKYVVLYGLPGVVASIEGYDAPPPPKCVLLVCRFSQIWRDFDAGLYSFMKRHIYVPWISNVGRGFLGKLEATILVFTFVYVWHGVTTQVLLWSAINFFGMLIEKSCDLVAVHPRYLSWEHRCLSPRMRRRFYGVLSGLLLVPSVAGLAIFLTSLENAKTVGRRLFIEGFPHVTLLFFFCKYCLAQIAFEVRNWKVRKGYKLLKGK